MSHESTKTKSDEWYTPVELFESLGCNFSLDPCSPGEHHWVPASKVFTKKDNGLIQNWGDSFVFMNPPFGGRNGQVPWLQKFLSHENGIGIVKSDTSTAWFQKYIAKMDTIVFIKGRTSFIQPDGTKGVGPGTGSVLFGIGKKANFVLKNCNLGFFVDNRNFQQIFM